MSKEKNIKLGRGWTCKSDTWILNKIEEVKNAKAVPKNKGIGKGNNPNSWNNRHKR